MTLLGTTVSRVDGRAKVTGSAQYTADLVGSDLLHAVLLGSSVPSGRLAVLDVTAAERAANVRLVLTSANRGALGALPDGSDWSGWPSESRPPLADDVVNYHGQYIAMIVADTIENARYAASLVVAKYADAPFSTDLAGAATSSHPVQVMGEELQVSRGDVESALATAAVVVDQTYVTSNQHPSAMEPHATVASWSDGELTVHNSTQWVAGNQVVLAAAFGVPPEKVHVKAPFVGGMFGSKVATAASTILAAVAAKRLGQPVKVVLTREQVLTTVGHRSETVQRVELGAQLDGELLAMRHRTVAHASVDEGGNPAEFHEPTSSVTRVLYTTPNYAATHEARRLNVPPPGWMRAPGEATGLWAIESAMDELAVRVGVDPVELRRRNHADRDPHHDLPWSSKHLLECYSVGAQRFGWDGRPFAAGSMREGDDLLGWGMATASYPCWRFGATVRVRLGFERGSARAVVSTAGSEVGNGAYTVLALTAADRLGIDPAQVTVELGDTSLPRSSQTGGSGLTASTAPAVAEACSKLLARLGSLDRLAEGDELVEEASTEPVYLRDGTFAYQSFGAHFVEVRVAPDIGRVRVSRVVSVFDIGRVLSAKTTRSQLAGAVVFGIGQALHEQLGYDPAHGRLVNADLAGYLVPVNADVPAVDVSWLDVPDLRYNPLGCRGAGEIGITGLAAAVGNAVHHATGIRVRALPIGPDSLL
jgi:xanthine dehydrogenase YagR molybdenum-binding subunit